MILKRFRYQESSWKLENCEFNDLNAIVGKNAVGKTKTLKALAVSIKFLRNELPSDYICHFKCELTLIEEKEYIYSFSVTDGNIEEESLTVDEEKIIDRKNGRSLLRKQPISPPQTSLILHTSRDTEKNPEFEVILNWANSVRGIRFNKESLYPFNDTYKIEDMLTTFNQDMIEKLKKILKRLDYNLIDIRPLESKTIFGTNIKTIDFKEEGVNSVLEPFSLSDGMYRAIYLLVYIYYISSVKGAKCILIDDLGEGLDFDRSSKLSRILFSYCEKNNIQLIVTSNDDFLLNSIPLKYWIILSRRGSVVSSISNSTDPELFKKFKFTGLNNFYIISSDFIERYHQEKH